MTDSVTEKYIALAIEHAEATKTGNYKIGDVAILKQWEIYKELRKTPDQGESVLLPLLEHKNPNVAVSAAIHLLPVSEVAAMQTLQRLATEAIGFSGFNARIAIKEWQAGRLKQKVD